MVIPFAAPSHTDSELGSYIQAVLLVPGNRRANSWHVGVTVFRNGWMMEEVVIYSVAWMEMMATLETSML